MLFNRDEESETCSIENVKNPKKYSQRYGIDAEVQ